MKIFNYMSFINFKLLAIIFCLLSSINIHATNDVSNCSSQIVNPSPESIPSLVKRLTILDQKIDPFNEKLYLAWITNITENVGLLKDVDPSFHKDIKDASKLIEELKITDLDIYETIKHNN